MTIDRSVPMIEERRRAGTRSLPAHVLDTIAETQSAGCESKFAENEAAQCNDRVDRVGVRWLTPR
jgi:hypothetical protein